MSSICRQDQRRNSIDHSFSYQKNGQPSLSSGKSGCRMTTRESAEGQRTDSDDESYLFHDSPGAAFANMESLFEPPEDFERKVREIWPRGSE
jgi:hypothetical protein